VVKLSVVCEACGGLEVAKVDWPTPDLGEALLVASHASKPHCSHKLDLLVDGINIVKLTGVVQLSVKCLGPGCKTKPAREVRTRPEYVGALVIAYHTDHEGHPLEVAVDGKKVHP
jgi:hypothetical protein